MNLKRIFGITIFLVIVISLVVFCKMSSPKIGFVRTYDLVNGFSGMKEAQKIFQQKKEKWQASLDSMDNELKQKLILFRRDSLNLNNAQRESRKQTLLLMRKGLIDYNEVLTERAASEDKKMTDAMLKQINSFIEDYGKRNNYTMIFGTSTSGSILYGDKKADITEELMTFVNDKYKGE